MKKSSDYWQRRFQAVEAMNNQTAKGTVQAITPAFDKAQAQIEKEIDAWYARFAKNNQISLTDAKALLNSRELKEFRWDVEEYIKHGKQNALDQKWLKELENASARFHISRLEALKIRTQNAAEMAFGNELDRLDEMAAKVYMDGYYHTAYEIQRGLGIGWDVSKIDDRKLQTILSKPWTADKMTFSDRIWKSKTQLIDSLHTELTQMCVLGKAPDQAIDAIAKRMNVSKGQAGRLVMTESAYFGSAAQKDCFTELDVEKFEVVATLDNRTSDICQDMDGKVFDMKDFQIGATAPPFHVWCRSCTAPYFPDNDDGTRAARGADGETYQVPASMKYEDWKKAFIGGGSKAGLAAFVSVDDLKKQLADKQDRMTQLGAEINIKAQVEAAYSAKTLKQIQEEIIRKHDSILQNAAHKSEFSEIVDGMDKERANLYEKMSEHFSKNNYYKKKSGYYSPSEKKVYMNMDRHVWNDSMGRSKKGAWKTKFHEEMHQLDHILGARKSPFAMLHETPGRFTYEMTATTTVTGKRMIEAIDEDILNFINKAVDWDIAERGVSAKHIKSLSRISGEAKDATIRYLKTFYPTSKDRAMIDTLTDVMGLTTNGNLHPYSFGFWGHDKTYSKQRSKNGATSEAWANMGCFFMQNDTEVLDVLKTVMPKTVETYQAVFNEIMEYAKINGLSYTP